MILLQPVKPRARRMHDIAASVPLFTIRTFSIDGIHLQIKSAISTSSRFGIPKLRPRVAASRTASTTTFGACPRMAGPQLPTKSIYSFPSTSQIFAPAARSMKNGSHPTLRNARTGEFTPPGMRFCAARNSSEEREVISKSKRSTLNAQYSTHQL